MEYFICNNCKTRITNLVEKSQQNPVKKEQFDLIEKGQYWINEKGDIFINLIDKANLEYHSDKKRLAGCCGSPEDGEPNLICKCSSEIAREVTDCIYPLYVRLIPEKISLFIDKWKLFSKFGNRDSVDYEKIDNLNYLFHFDSVENALSYFREKY